MIINYYLNGNVMCSKEWNDKMQVERSSLKFMLSFFQVMNGRKGTKSIFGDIYWRFQMTVLRYFPSFCLKKLQSSKGDRGALYGTCSPHWKLCPFLQWSSFLACTVSSNFYKFVGKKLPLSLSVLFRLNQSHNFRVNIFVA